MNDRVIEFLKNKKPLLWINPKREAAETALSGKDLNEDDILDAQARFYRFAPLLMELFEELEESGGLIESNLTAVPGLSDFLRMKHEINEDIGRVLIKEDHNLPVAGSVKARGGIYEVLCFAEELALNNGLLEFSDNYIKLKSESCRKLFSKYTVSVGSTGNLGLSVGVMSAALGFTACVHMSREAKEWKKSRLRGRGVNVIEHDCDYTSAVRAGKVIAEVDPFNYFVDDENSKKLFIGYSVAAFRLQKQLREQNIVVDDENPLFVYLPCGIGGAPGGITLGLKQVFGNSVHCFFAEPSASPCMILGLSSGKHSDISVYDIGLDNKTEADGLAVSSPSGFVGKFIQPLISGAYTFDEADMYPYLQAAYKLEQMKIEPSATAGFAGPHFIFNTENGREYLRRFCIDPKRITHILWTTGGRFVPDTEFQDFLER
jgi:D-serine ammonia-lyase